MMRKVKDTGKYDYQLTETFLGIAPLISYQGSFQTEDKKDYNVLIMDLLG